jgi:sigma-B regulation protein RsbU (phosphoserine phosphatase)
MLPDFPWTEDTTTLAAGDQLAIFSDGIPEAQRGDEFFDDARVTEAMQAAAAAPDPERGAQAVFERVEAFLDGGPRTDDVTLVLLRRA